MKQTWKVGIVILACLMIAGCESDSGRLATLAEKTIESQNLVNANVTEAQEKLVDLNREIQIERSQLRQEKQLLNQQFERLEKERRDLHRLRRSELAWSESFRFLAIVIAAIMPLFLCAYLIWAASQKSVNQDDVNAILIRELASSEPRLIAAPNLPRIDHRPKHIESKSKTNKKPKRKRNRRKNDVTHRKNSNTSPRR